MYCGQCGRELPDGAEKCPYCYPAEDGESPIEQGKDESAVYEFYRAGKLLFITYASVATNVELGNDALKVSEQTTWFGFFKPPLRQRLLRLDQIISIECKPILLLMGDMISLALLVLIANAFHTWYALGFFVLDFAMLVLGRSAHVAKIRSSDGSILKVYGNAEVSRFTTDLQKRLG